MKTLTATLQLSTQLHGKHRDRCPSLVFSSDGEQIAAIRSDCTLPELPLPDDSLNRIIVADDAISRVLDEEAWLTELSRLLTVGGELAFTLPADGPLAWLDALTIYRYVADVSGRGDDPDSTRPTGWNRHYSHHAIQQLLQTAGLQLSRIHRINYAPQEVGMLASLLCSNWIKGNRSAEMHAWQRFGRRTPKAGSGSLFGTTWSITATKLAEPDHVEEDPTAEPIDPTADPSE